MNRGNPINSPGRVGDDAIVARSYPRSPVAGYMTLSRATEGSRRGCDRVLNERSAPLLTEVGNGGAVDARLAESTR